MVSDSVAYVHLCIHTHKPIPYSNNFRAEVLQEFRRNVDKNGNGVVDLNVKARLIFVENNDQDEEDGENKGDVMPPGIKKEIKTFFEADTVKHFNEYWVPCL